MAASRTAWSRTTPPSPTSSRAASNCGFTKVRNAPCGRSSSMTAGSTVVTDVNETSQTARSTQEAPTAAGTSTMLVRSIRVTLASCRSAQSNCA